MLGVVCVVGGVLLLAALSSGLLSGAPASDPHVCSMTYMWPSYKKVNMQNKTLVSEDYELYYFREETGSHSLVRSKRGLNVRGIDRNQANMCICFRQVMI